MCIFNILFVQSSIDCLCKTNCQFHYYFKSEKFSFLTLFDFLSIEYMSGLTKPGKVSDIVALVSMKSPYSCPKGEVLVTH